MHALESNSVPGVPFIKRGPDGIPWLEGSQCNSCMAMLVGGHANCPACGGRGTPKPIRLAEYGTLYSYTIVYRSFPGVATPFVSAIVDLTGGGSLRGTLLEVEPRIEALRYDMPIDIVFRDTNQKNKEGHAFFSYFFVPARSRSI